MQRIGLPGLLEVVRDVREVVAVVVDERRRGVPRLIRGQQGRVGRAGVVVGCLHEVEEQVVEQQPPIRRRAFCP